MLSLIFISIKSSILSFVKKDYTPNKKSSRRAKIKIKKERRKKKKLEIKKYKIKDKNLKKQKKIEKSRR